MLEKRTEGDAIDDKGTVEELERYIYSNQLQSASLKLDASGAIISYEEYHPYGTTSYQAMNASINAVAKRYRYTGKERDEESGLYYHGARYYIPWLCRWSAVDPLQNEMPNWSSYNYGFCNPVKWTDLSGAKPGDPPGQKSLIEADNTQQASTVDLHKNEFLKTPTGGDLVLPINAEVTQKFRGDELFLDGKSLGFPYAGSVWTFDYLGEEYKASFRNDEFVGYFSMQNKNHYLSLDGNTLPVPEEETFWVRISGAGQALSGVAGMVGSAVGGILSSETAVGAALGWGGLVYSADHASEGVYKMIYGTSQGTLLNKALMSSGMSETPANMINMTLGLGLGVANYRIATGLSFSTSTTIGQTSSIAAKGEGLAVDVAKTFRFGRYTEVTLDKPLVLSRYYDNANAFAKGRFMTNSTSSFTFLDRIGMAIRPSWNGMTKVAHWEIPAG